MPIYEYSCARCGVEKEVLHGINEKPAIACPNCEGEYLQKLVSAAGFRLKGGGWYETDFKSQGKRNLAGDASADGAVNKADGEGKKPEGKSDDSKPAAGTKEGAKDTGSASAKDKPAGGSSEKPATSAPAT